MKKIVCLLFIAISITVHAVTIYSNNFDAGNSSLAGLLRYGSQVSIENGQLKLAGGTGYDDRAGAAIYLPGLSPEYKSTLSQNKGLITWAFNISNIDGAYNNLFRISPAYSSNDLSYSSGYGYTFKGGGMVQERMYLNAVAYSNSPFGPVNQIMIDETDGIGTITNGKKGSVKITYNPAGQMWSLYAKESEQYFNPEMLSSEDLVGTAFNSTFTGQLLPYFVMDSYSTGAAYIDNLTISIIPEPASLLLLGLGGLVIRKR